MSKKDAWKRLHDLYKETTRTWKIRSDLDVQARGPDRCVSLTIWEDQPRSSLEMRRIKVHMDRNVNTMRELALAIWAACDHVEEMNPTWAKNLPEPSPPDTFIENDE